MDVRKLVAEFLGTALLVIFAVGVATLSFGFGLTGASVSAGVVATALAFGLTVLALAYAIGPISGCHVNPAVTMGFLVSGRMDLEEAVGYWLAQFLGGIVGALVLWGIFETSPAYSRATTGLGADGFGKASMIHIDAGGAFLAEVVLTFLFVFVVLGATSRLASIGFGGLAIGLALTVVHLVGIPLTGTSVNPARSLGPALIVGHTALTQIWVFILAPLVGGALAALAYHYFFGADEGVTTPVAGDTVGTGEAAVATGDDLGDAGPAIA
ncbi:MAG TPA: MIP family channel protein [Mycobacteriales bacterium]|nr:MIP family channel protein [Mycobacteriales bacterium]